ncbi:MAG: MFS transporter, partial [Solobacterium sp.]|nr:MFS transporter [Solobacterium sp.]
GTYTLFSSVGGASQILGMMIVYPLLRKKFGNTQIFRMCLSGAICGYALLLAVCLLGLAHNIAVILVPGIMVFLCNGILTVLTTVFLSASVDYGELKTGHREESVIFSMQTFVVKLASGVAVFMTGIGISLIGLVGNADTTGEIVAQSSSTLLGLRLLMTIIPILGLVCAFFVFKTNSSSPMKEAMKSRVNSKQSGKGLLHESTIYTDNPGRRKERGDRRI